MTMFLLDIYNLTCPTQSLPHREAVYPDLEANNIPMPAKNFRQL